MRTSDAAPGAASGPAGSGDGTGGGRTVETALSELVVQASATDIPTEACEAAVRQAFDCIGVTLAAAAEPAGEILAATSRMLGGTPQAGILGTGVRTSVVQAAWANGALAHLLDFDDTGFSHPTACILPAALATGQHARRTGAEVVEALVLGYEVFERLAVTARPDEPVLRRRGLHPTSLWGAPAAAAASGRLLGLDERQMRVALGIAASDASGLTQQFGTWSKGLSAGNAARAGVTAALLARAGYRGDEEGLAGPYGLLSAVVGAGRYDVSVVEDGLGKRWAIVDPGLSIKPYPACTSTLRAVGAMLRIASSGEYHAAAVERVVVHVHPDLLHTLRFRAPTDGFRGKFSLDYTVATAALDGEVTIASFSDAAAVRPELRAMLARVELREHPEWDIADRHANPVEVVLAGGQVLSASVPAHRGTRAWPLTHEEVVAKYVGCATRCLGAERAARSVDAVLGLAAAPDADAVVAAVMPEATAAPA